MTPPCCEKHGVPMFLLRVKQDKLGSISEYQCPNCEQERTEALRRLFGPAMTFKEDK